MICLHGFPLLRPAGKRSICLLCFLFPKHSFRFLALDLGIVFLNLLRSNARPGLTALSSGLGALFAFLLPPGRVAVEGIADESEGHLQCPAEIRLCPGLGIVQQRGKQLPALAVVQQPQWQPDIGIQHKGLPAHGVRLR